MTLSEQIEALENDLQQQMSCLLFSHGREQYYQDFCNRYGLEYGED